MVVAQVAVSLVLVVAAMLFVRSFQNLMTLDPGLRENLPRSSDRAWAHDLHHPGPRLSGDGLLDRRSHARPPLPRHSERYPAHGDRTRLAISHSGPMDSIYGSLELSFRVSDE